MNTTENKIIQSNTAVFSGKRNDEELAWFKLISARRTPEKLKRLRANHKELLITHDIKTELFLTDDFIITVS